MKLVIQIPAYNEENSLARVIEDIRQNLPMAPFEQTEIVVINDCSTDNTIEVAARANIQHIVNLKEHGGLGIVFKKGLEYSLNIGADVIVNTDADLQYRAEDIKSLVKPVVEGRADMVIGDRQLALIPNYPKAKCMAQQLGNSLISTLYHADIKDATSGFRAISKECAQSLTARLDNAYTYTIESLCLLLNSGQRIVFVPIEIRKSIRESRLIRNKAYYVQNYLLTIFKRYSKRGPKTLRQKDLKNRPLSNFEESID